MKIRSVLAGMAFASVLAMSAGGAVMAADGEECTGDCVQERLRTQERTCSETCTRLQTRSRDCASQDAVDVTALTGDEVKQAGNSHGETGDGTGPGLNRQWGKSAH